MLTDASRRLSWVRAGGRLSSATQLRLCHNTASRCEFRPKYDFIRLMISNCDELTDASRASSLLPPSSWLQDSVVLLYCCLPAAWPLLTLLTLPLEKKEKTPRELTLLRNGIDVGRKVNGDVDASRKTSHFSTQVYIMLCRTIISFAIM